MASTPLKMIMVNGRKTNANNKAIWDVNRLSAASLNLAAMDEDNADQSRQVDNL